MNQKLKNKIHKIKLIATDVDGVLTDGGMYYSSKGNILKKFQARDGMAVSILKRNIIPTVIITKERNQTVKKWSSKMSIDKLFDGIENKENIIPKLCKFYSLSENNIAYIGDDVNDLEILKRIGFSATPKDGNLEVKKIVDYICKNRGGEGVLREICDLIISIKFGKKKKLY
jgi:YrbI family 3-deoxy-D-manno-octulosonate 8-phosphate phosphatase